MNRVFVTDRTRTSAGTGRKLMRVVEGAMTKLRLRNHEVSILIVGDAAIRQLNRRYRGKDRPTDVLSFSQTEGKSLPGTHAHKHLGDIVISAPTAKRQARRRSASQADEFELLAVHGLLHLLGYDHATPRQEKRMFGLQLRLLKKARRA